MVQLQNFRDVQLSGYADQQKQKAHDCIALAMTHREPWVWTAPLLTPGLFLISFMSAEFVVLLSTAFAVISLTNALTTS